MKENELTLNQIVSVVSYEKDTGYFKWVNDMGATRTRKRKKGERAETKHKEGYLVLNFLTGSFLAHRVAFFYM